MKHFTQTALSSIDSYKLGHADQFPEGTTKVYSNFTPRSLKHLQVPYQYGTTQVVWFGLQAFLNDLQSVWQETFFDRTKEEVVSEFMELVGPFCGPRGFNQSRIEWLHDLGYLPIEIKSLPEGTLVPAGVPVLTITNTLPEAYGLPNFLETWLSADLWKPSTAATISYTYRKIIDHYTELTGGNKDFVIAE
jgi:nicotinamide phosphoribosyltransferase